MCINMHSIGWHTESALLNTRQSSKDTWIRFILISVQMDREAITKNCVYSFNFQIRIQFWLMAEGSGNEERWQWNSFRSMVIQIWTCVCVCVCLSVMERLEYMLVGVEVSTLSWPLTPVCLLQSSLRLFDVLGQLTQIFSWIWCEVKLFF